MGKKSGHSWLDAVKNAFRSPPTKDGDKRCSRRRDDNEPEEEEKRREKKKWSFRRHFSLETKIQHNVVRICSGDEDVVRKVQPKMEYPAASEQRSAFEVAMAAAATAQAAVEIIRLTRPSLLVIQDQAALVIQKIFRGYLARRALLALKGVVKLQALIRGHNVRKRAKMTLQCIQSLVRVQALVCDQRRRLSCQGSMLTHDNTLPKCKTTDVEVEALIKKAKECSLKQGKTLAHALSQQISDKNLSELSEEQYLVGKTWFRKDRNLCHPNPVKTIEVDYSRTPPTYLNKTRDDSLLIQSPRTPSSLKIKSIHRMSMSENSSCPLPRPNYMAATASATARFRVSPTTTPRQRLSSPTTNHSARKRLSFPDHDNHIRCRGITQFDGQQMPYYATD